MSKATMVTLAELNIGDQAIIRGFHSGHRAYRQQLLAMGLTPNTRFVVVRRAPMGDPVEIRIRNFNLSLRQSESLLLKIERLSA